MNEIQITIPAEVLTATAKILGSYQSRLEREAKVRLSAFYAGQLGAWYKQDEGR